MTPVLRLMFLFQINFNFKYQYPPYKIMHTLLGCFGVCMIITKKKEPTWRSLARRSWVAMHNRVSLNNSYKDVKICDSWYEFKNFAEWFKIQYDNGWWTKGWHLDKDIISRGGKLYSPETCAYVLPALNLAFVQAFNKFTNYNAARGVVRIQSPDRDIPDVFSASFDYDGMTYHLGEFDYELYAFFTYKWAKEEFLQERATEIKHKLNPKMYEAIMSYRIQPR